MNKQILADILDLEAKDRILLIQFIWDSVSDLPEATQLTKKQMKALEKRAEELDNNPEMGLSWEEVMASVRTTGCS